MTPTLIGRIQSRLFLVFTFGLVWTVLLIPFMPVGSGGPMLRALFIVGILGVGWELVYHLLQQYRWEKDWPSLFGLLTAIPEGLLVWSIMASEMGGSVFFVHFVTTWIVIWLAAHGPMRVLFLRWRFRGGRVL